MKIQIFQCLIKVRGLIKLSQEEKNDKMQKMQVRQQQIELEKTKKAQDKLSVQNKLRILGLTNDEISALKG